MDQTLYKGIRKYADKYLKDSGIQIVGDFEALGSYMKSNPGRPNEEDCADAANFAQTIAETLKNSWLHNEFAQKRLTDSKSYGNISN